MLKSKIVRTNTPSYHLIKSNGRKTLCGYRIQSDWSVEDPQDEVESRCMRCMAVSRRMKTEPPAPFSKSHRYSYGSEREV